MSGFLIHVGVLPFRDRFRTMAQALVRSANAAVVGILGAARFTPVFTGAVPDLRSFALAPGCFVLLMAWQVPPWLVVCIAAAGGAGLALAG